MESLENATPRLKPRQYACFLVLRKSESEGTRARASPSHLPVALKFMSDETPLISIPLRRMTQAELDTFLEKAADILRGNVDHSEFRGYVFALLFFKRISDIFEEAVRNLAKTVGDELANDPAMQKK